MGGFAPRSLAGGLLPAPPHLTTLSWYGTLTENIQISQIWLDTLRSFHQAIIPWFNANQRDLPWRHTSDAYKVWVSEIMLQQTQVNTVIPYYERWLQAFPNIETLARATEHEVFKLWAGLGYYRRAANMLKAARYLVTNNQGVFPKTFSALQKIPGVGPYTAGAIASFAHGENVAAVDANVERVLCRILCFEEDITVTKHRKTLRSAADYLASLGSADIVNQAMMDLGAGLCARSPKCAHCFARTLCAGFAQGKEAALPRKQKRVARYDELRAALVVFANSGLLLMVRRKNTGLLGGLWELPSVTLEKTKQNTTANLLEIQSIGNLRSTWENSLKPLLWLRCDWSTLHRLPTTVFHTFTHIDMRLMCEVVRAVHVEDAQMYCAPDAYFDQARFVDLHEAESLGCSSLFCKALKNIEVF